MSSSCSRCPPKGGTCDSCGGMNLLSQHPSTPDSSIPSPSTPPRTCSQLLAEHGHNLQPAERKLLETQPDVLACPVRYLSAVLPSESKEIRSIVEQLLALDESPSTASSDHGRSLRYVSSLSGGLTANYKEADFGNSCVVVQVSKTDGPWLYLDDTRFRVPKETFPAFVPRKFGGFKFRGQVERLEKREGGWNVRFSRILEVEVPKALDPRPDFEGVLKHGPDSAGVGWVTVGSSPRLTIPLKESSLIVAALNARKLVALCPIPDKSQDAVEVEVEGCKVLLNCRAFSNATARDTFLKQLDEALDDAPIHPKFQRRANPNSLFQDGGFYLLESQELPPTILLYPAQSTLYFTYVKPDECLLQLPDEHPMRADIVFGEKTEASKTLIRLLDIEKAVNAFKAAALESWTVCSSTTTTVSVAPLGQSVPLHETLPSSLSLGESRIREYKETHDLQKIFEHVCVYSGCILNGGVPTTMLFGVTDLGVTCGVPAQKPKKFCQDLSTLITGYAAQRRKDQLPWVPEVVIARIPLTPCQKFFPQDPSGILADPNSNKPFLFFMSNVKALVSKMDKWKEGVAPSPQLEGTTVSLVPATTSERSAHGKYVFLHLSLNDTLSLDLRDRKVLSKTIDEVLKKLTGIQSVHEDCSVDSLFSIISVTFPLEKPPSFPVFLTPPSLGVLRPTGNRFFPIKSTDCDKIRWPSPFWWAFQQRLRPLSSSSGDILEPSCVQLLKALHHFDLTAHDFLRPRRIFVLTVVSVPSQEYLKDLLDLCLANSRLVFMLVINLSEFAYDGPPRDNRVTVRTEQDLVSDALDLRNGDPEFSKFIKTCFRSTRDSLTQCHYWNLVQWPPEVVNLLTIRFALLHDLASQSHVSNLWLDLNHEVSIDSDANCGALTSYLRAYAPRSATVDLLISSGGVRIPSLSTARLFLMTPEAVFRSLKAVLRPEHTAAYIPDYNPAGTPVRRSMKTVPAYLQFWMCPTLWVPQTVPLRSTIMDEYLAGADPDWNVVSQKIECSYRLLFGPLVSNAPLEGLDDHAQLVHLDELHPQEAVVSLEDFFSRISNLFTTSTGSLRGIHILSSAQAGSSTLAFQIGWKFREKYFVSFIDWDQRKPILKECLRALSDQMEALEGGIPALVIIDHAPPKILDQINQHASSFFKSRAVSVAITSTDPGDRITDFPLGTEFQVWWLCHFLAPEGITELRERLSLLIRNLELKPEEHGRTFTTPYYFGLLQLLTKSRDQEELKKTYSNWLERLIQPVKDDHQVLEGLALLCLGRHDPVLSGIPSGVISALQRRTPALYPVLQRVAVTHYTHHRGLRDSFGGYEVEDDSESRFTSLSLRKTVEYLFPLVEKYLPADVLPTGMPADIAAFIRCIFGLSVDEISYHISRSDSTFLYQLYMTIFCLKSKSTLRSVAGKLLSDASPSNVDEFFKFILERLNPGILHQLASSQRFNWLHAPVRTLLAQGRIIEQLGLHRTQGSTLNKSEWEHVFDLVVQAENKAKDVVDALSQPTLEHQILLSELFENRGKYFRRQCFQLGATRMIPASAHDTPMAPWKAIISVEECFVNSRNFYLQSLEHYSRNIGSTFGLIQLSRTFFKAIYMLLKKGLGDRWTTEHQAATKYLSPPKGQVEKVRDILKALPDRLEQYCQRLLLFEHELLTEAGARRHSSWMLTHCARAEDGFFYEFQELLSHCDNFPYLGKSLDKSPTARVLALFRALIPERDNPQNNQKWTGEISWMSQVADWNAERRTNFGEQLLSEAAHLPSPSPLRDHCLQRATYATLLGTLTLHAKIRFNSAMKMWQEKPCSLPELRVWRCFLQMAFDFVQYLDRPTLESCASSQMAIRNFLTETTRHGLSYPKPEFCLYHHPESKIFALRKLSHLLPKKDAQTGLSPFFLAKIRREKLRSDGASQQTDIAELNIGSHPIHSIPARRATTMHRNQNDVFVSVHFSLANGVFACVQN